MPPIRMKAQSKILPAGAEQRCDSCASAHVDDHDPFRTGTLRCYYNPPTLSNGRWGRPEVEAADFCAQWNPKEDETVEDIAER